MGERPACRLMSTTFEKNWLNLNVRSGPSKLPIFDNISHANSNTSRNQTIRKPSFLIELGAFLTGTDVRILHVFFWLTFSHAGSRTSTSLCAYFPRAGTRTGHLWRVFRNTIGIPNRILYFIWRTNSNQKILFLETILHWSSLIFNRLLSNRNSRSRCTSFSFFTSNFKGTVTFKVHQCLHPSHFREVTLSYSPSQLTALDLNVVAGSIRISHCPYAKNISIHIKEGAHNEAGLQQMSVHSSMKEKVLQIAAMVQKSFFCRF